MIEFAMEFLMARLMVVPKTAAAKKPCVVITGIKAESHLQALPAVFTRYPIFFSPEGTEFGVQIVTDTPKKYEG